MSKISSTFQVMIQSVFKVYRLVLNYAGAGAIAMHFTQVPALSGYWANSKNQFLNFAICCAYRIMGRLETVL